MNKGIITPALLVITTAFIIAIYGLLAILTLQFDFSNRQVSSERSLNIAEAGIEYYKWHLLKDPNDYQDGTGSEGPYVHDYADPQGNVVGQFSLHITPPSGGNTNVTVRSTGWTNHHPKVQRTIVATFGQLNLAAFAFVHNSNLWFSNDITVNGPVFNNGGIRMDGTNTSTMQSAKTTYTCGIESGCNAPEEKPGIWGNGHDETLWEFPVPPIDFDGMNVNFAQTKTDAQDSGLYLAPSGQQGYHVVFDSDGSFDVYEVTGVDYIEGSTPEEDCLDLYQTITSEVFVNSYQVADNEIIFVEDVLWIEGVVSGKTTVAVARFPLGTFETNIWIPNNLTYDVKDGSTHLGLISQDDIVFNRDVPGYFEVNAVLLAHNGRVIRHHYGTQECRSGGDERNKNEFTFFGSMISDEPSIWNFSSGPSDAASGFVKSYLNFDPNLADDPPGYFPTTQTRLTSWKEE